MKTKYEIVMRLDYCKLPLAQALLAFGEGWPLFRDHGLRLIDSTECARMRADESLGGSDWNLITKGYALVAKEGVRKYSTTFDRLTQGLCDFKDGWYAAEKLMKPEVELGRLSRSWSLNLNTGYRAKRRVPTKRKK
jgi:hypothetical protein